MQNIKGELMKLGCETGSLVNHVMTMSKKIPVVGIGATECMYTDRKAGTVVEVGPRHVMFQEDISKRTDKNGMSEVQSYEYARNPKAPKRMFKLTTKGYVSDTGSHLAIGYRNTYYDYSF